MDYDNTNRGTLFPNDKADNPKRPDYTGTINVEGKEYKLSAWLKPPSGSVKDDWFSITIQPKENSGYTTPPQAQNNQQPESEAPDNTLAVNDEFGDDLPF